MIHQMIATFKNVIVLTYEQKKDKLVELRVRQLIRDQINGGESDIPPAEEIEVMAILQTMFPLDDPDTVEKMITLRNEISVLAQEKLNHPTD